MLGVIKEELTEIAERFGDERRTEISHSEDEIDIEDLIADQQMVITITQSGYIKSLPLATYRQQQRGGRGVTGMDMKDGDFIEHLFVTSSHDYLLFFSNRGKVYRSKVYELPEAQRTAKGRALVNILPLREGERIQAVVSTRDFSETQYLVFATRNGTVKKTELAAYNTPIKADGIIAINIREDDELLAVRAVDPDDEVIMVSKAGLTVRFAESDVRAMGRDTTGVRGMDVGKKGSVISMDVARDDMDLLVVTENGYGKRTQISQYRKTNRGAKGVKTIGLTEAKGALAGALVVREHQELVFISVGGMVQRTAAGGISQQGRSATGVRVMNLKDEDAVSAVALVVDTGRGGGESPTGIELQGEPPPAGELNGDLPASSDGGLDGEPDAGAGAARLARDGRRCGPAGCKSSPTGPKLGHGTQGRAAVIRRRGGAAPPSASPPRPVRCRRPPARGRGWRTGRRPCPLLDADADGCHGSRPRPYSRAMRGRSPRPRSPQRLKHSSQACAKGRKARPPSREPAAAPEQRLRRTTPCRHPPARAPPQAKTARR